MHSGLSFASLLSQGLRFEAYSARGPTCRYRRVCSSRPSSARGPTTDEALAQRGIETMRSYAMHSVIAVSCIVHLRLVHCNWRTSLYTYYIVTGELVMLTYEIYMGHFFHTVPFGLHSLGKINNWFCWKCLFYYIGGIHKFPKNRFVKLRHIKHFFALFFP